MPNLYGTADVAAMLGVTIQHVRYLARELKIGQRVGTSWIFDDADVAALRARNTTPGPVPRKEKRPRSEEQGRR